jgi:hypothetical protein
MGAPDAAGIYLGALDGRAPTRLTPGDSSAVYLTDGQGPGGSLRGGGWLLWVRTGMLVAQQLDVEKAALIGEPVTVADGVDTDGSSRSAVSVATAGLVAYRTGARSQRQLTWFDRSGVARGTVGDPDATLARPRTHKGFDLPRLRPTQEESLLTGDAVDDHRRPPAERHLVSLGPTGPASARAILHSQREKGRPADGLFDRVGEVQS